MVSEQVIPMLSAADEQRIRELDGFYVGTLTDEEHELFSRACVSGIVRRTHDHIGGFLGLAKVQVIT